MRSQDEIQEMADATSRVLDEGRLDPLDRTTLHFNGWPYEAEYVRGVLAALDWALDDSDEKPIDLHEEQS